MTSHRLIDTTLTRLTSAATALHQPACVDQHHGRRIKVSWRTAVPGHCIDWTLEMEQGANGVLAHLSAEPSVGPLTRLAGRWRRVALQPLSARRLRELAEAARATGWCWGPVESLEPAEKISADERDSPVAGSRD